MTDTKKRYLDIDGLKQFYALLNEKFATKVSSETLSTSLASIQSAIDILNGAATVNGSVAKQIADSKASIEGIIDTKVNEAVTNLIGGAGSAFDTLKEIEDWIETHAGSAASLASSVSALQTAVGRQASEGVEATGLYKKVAEIESALETAGDENVIEEIKFNGTKVEPTDKVVSINAITGIKVGTETMDVVDGVVTLDTQSESTVTTTATLDVGGIKKGQSIDNLTLQEIVDLLISPYVATSNVSISAKNASNGSVTTSSLEKGNGFTIAKAYVSWTAGSTQVTKVDVYKGAIANKDSITEAEQANLLGSATVTTGTSTYVDIEDVTCEVGSNTPIKLTAIVTDKNGTKRYAKSADFGSWYVPYFYGKTTKALNDLTVADIVAMTAVNGTGKGKVTFGNTAVGEICVIALRSTLSSALDPSGFENFANFEHRAMTLARNNWSGEAFHVYAVAPGKQTGWFYTFA